MVEFCLGKEKEKKNPGSRGGTRGPVRRENYIFWSENESPINCVHEITSVINT